MLAVSVVVLGVLLDENQPMLAGSLHHNAVSASHPVTSAVCDDKPSEVQSMDPTHTVDCSDLFYDTNWFASNETDLLSGLAVSAGLDLLCGSEPMMGAGMDLFAGCDSQMDDNANAEIVLDGNDETQTLELLSQAGIQQPAERQIRLHSELVQHLSSSPNDSVFATPMTSSSQESELVRMLTSLEDKVSVAELLSAQETFDMNALQHVPVMSIADTQLPDAWSSADVSTDSELARQLSLCTDDVHVACPSVTSSRHQSHQQHGHQRVALVQPQRTIAHRDNMITSQLIVHQPHVSTQQSIEQPAESTQPLPRQIVITTQAPVQAQHVPQISLHQLQQVHIQHTIEHCVSFSFSRECLPACAHGRLSELSEKHRQLISE